MVITGKMYPFKKLIEMISKDGINYYIKFLIDKIFKDRYIQF